MTKRNQKTWREVRKRDRATNWRNTWNLNPWRKVRVYAEEESEPRRIFVLEGAISNKDASTEARSIRSVGSRFHSSLEVSVKRESAVVDGREKYERFLQGEYNFKLKKSQRVYTVDIPYKNILRIEQEIYGQT